MPEGYWTLSIEWADNEGMEDIWLRSLDKLELVRIASKYMGWTDLSIFWTAFDDLSRF